MNAHTPQNAYEQLAEFAARTKFDTLPDDVIARAHWVLLDTTGVIIGGMQEPEIQNLINWVAQNYPGEARLIGTDVTVRPEWAAFIYGLAGTTLEFDEGHAGARGHAAIHAVATVLALASAGEISGKDLIASLVMGYEVAARIGIACKLRDDVHPFGAWGVIGAATIGARFENASPADMQEIFDLAASYAITPSYKTALQGANVRNTYAGMVNYNGLLAVTMHQMGFRGEQDGIATAFGKILGTSLDVDILVAELGERFEILNGYFKPYSSCRYSHAAIDAILALQDPVKLGDIQQVVVETYEFASKLNLQKPDTPLAARFSIPYIVATTLYDGDASPLSFTQTAIQREDVLALAAKVDVKESAAYTQLASKKRAAKVTIHYGDSIIQSESIGSKGDPDRAMSDNELRAKFDSLTAHIPGDYRDFLWQQLGDLTRLDSTRMLFEPDRDKQTQDQIVEEG